MKKRPLMIDKAKEWVKGENLKVSISKTKVAFPPKRMTKDLKVKES